MTIRLSTPVTGAILVTPTGATLHPTLAAARLAAPPGGRVYAITTTVGDLLAREAVADPAATRFRPWVADAMQVVATMQPVPEAEFGGGARG